MTFDYEHSNGGRMSECESFNSILWNRKRVYKSLYFIVGTCYIRLWDNVHV